MSSIVVMWVKQYVVIKYTCLPSMFLVELFYYNFGVQGSTVPDVVV